MHIYTFALFPPVFLKLVQYTVAGTMGISKELLLLYRTKVAATTIVVVLCWRYDYGWLKYDYGIMTYCSSSCTTSTVLLRLLLTTYFSTTPPPMRAGLSCRGWLLCGRGGGAGRKRRRRTARRRAGGGGDEQNNKTYGAIFNMHWLPIVKCNWIIERHPEILYLNIGANYHIKVSITQQ